MRGSAEEKLVENSGRSDSKNMYVFEEGPDRFNKLKFILPKVLLFTSIFLLVTLILVFAIRLSYDDPESSESNNVVMASYLFQYKFDQTTVQSEQKENSTPSTPDDGYNECRYRPSNSVNQTNEKRIQTDVLSRIKEQQTIPLKCKQERPKLILVLPTIPSIQREVNLNAIDCGKDFCKFTDNQSEFSKADAVIFQGQRGNENDILTKDYPNATYLLPSANPSQIWIFKVLQPIIPFWYDQFRNFSNCFSASYDLKSDIPYLTYFYSDKGNTSLSAKNETQLKVKVAVYNKNCWEEERFLNIHGRVLENLARSNVTLDFYRSSNPPERCNVSYNSEHQLERNCTKLSLVECYRRISPWYKFSLAFEIYNNSDYISERFFAPLMFGMIPIVIENHNRQNYESLAPNNSYIPLNNQTVGLLHEINSDKTKLKEYFKWWNKGRIVERKRLQWFCQACGHVFKSQFRRQTNETTGES